MVLEAWSQWGALRDHRVDLPWHLYHVVSLRMLHPLHNGQVQRSENVRDDGRSPGNRPRPVVLLRFQLHVRRFFPLCARFNLLLTDERFDYEVWGTNYEQEDEVIHWLSSKWFKASDQTLIEHECPTKKSLFERDAQPVPGDACNIGPSLWFSAEILR